MVITSVSLGIFAMILSMAFINGMNEQMVENTISTSLGHVAIHGFGYQKNMKLQNSFSPGRDISDALEGDRDVLGYAPRVKVKGMIRSSESSRGVIVVGIDPGRERKISRIDEYTSRDEGSGFLDDPSADEVLISRVLAKKLDLVVGDKLVLMIQDRENQIVGVGMTVRGVFQTPIETFDKFVVFAGLHKLQEITGLGDRLSEYTILVKDRNAVDRIRDDLIGRIGRKGLEVLSWKDMAPNLVSAIKLFDSMMYIFFGIIFLTVVFSIANTLIMAIMERFHELGVMKSIGTRPSWIFLLIMLEALQLGFVGLMLGVAAGWVTAGILNITGIDLSFYKESMRVWGTGSLIYPTIKSMDILVASLIVLMTTVLAALYPATRAARIKPLEALNYL